MIYLDNNTEQQTIYIPRNGVVADYRSVGPLQSKSYTITENSTTVIVPDQGYEGISGGTIVVDVQNQERCYLDIEEYPNVISLNSQRTFGITITTDADWWSLSDNDTLDCVTFDGVSGVTGTSGVTVVTVNYPDTLIIKSQGRWQSSVPVFPGSIGYREHRPHIQYGLTDENMEQSVSRVLFKQAEFNYVCNFQYVGDESYGKIDFIYEEERFGDAFIKLEGDIEMLYSNNIGTNWQTLTNNEWTRVDCYDNNIRFLLKTNSPQQKEGVITVKFVDDASQAEEIVDVFHIYANN